MNEDRYEITSLIGKGRTGGVYLAIDHHTQSKIAIRRFYSVVGDTSSTAWEEEFHSITRTLDQLAHPNILPFLEAGVDEDGVYLTYQFLEGRRLSEVVVEQRLTEAEAIDMAKQLLSALSAAHQAHFIHGALTAGSIFLTTHAGSGPRYTIMDLGLSHLAPLIQGADSSYAMMADPALIAPELFDGIEATQTSDCYMLGQLVYLSLLGGHPFALKEFDTVKQLHQSGSLPEITDYRDDISPQFRAWITSLTQRDPALRPQSAEQALESLEKAISSYQAQEAQQSPPPPPPVSKAEPASEQAQPPATKKSQMKHALLLSLVFFLFTSGLALTIYQHSYADRAITQAPPANPLPQPPHQPTELAVDALYTVSAHSAHPVRPCLLSDETMEDWIVFHFPPPPLERHRHPAGNLITGFQPLGTLTPELSPTRSIVFSANEERHMRPNLSGKCLTPGDGWRIQLQLEDTAHLLKLHFTTWNCDAQLQLTDSDGSAITRLKHFQAEHQNTSFGIAFVLTPELLKGHTQINLDLTTSGVQSDIGHGLGLNALSLERLHSD